jgi:hypothetical protein
MNVFKYEKEKALTIIDSLYEYFERQQPDDMSFKNSLGVYLSKQERMVFQF